MKNNILVMLVALAAMLVPSGALGQMKVVANSFKDINSNDAQTSGFSMGSMNMIAMSEEWPDDADGGDKVAELLIQFKNVPLSEYLNFKITDTQEVMPCNPSEMRVIEQEGQSWLKVFIPAHDNADIDVAHPDYGTTRIVNKNIKKHHVYIVTIENAKLVNIVVTSDPVGALVELDGKRMAGVTPMTIPNVTLGRHELALYPQSGVTVAKDVARHAIDVTDAKTTFEYNMRKTMHIEFQSEPDGAFIDVIKDGKKVQSGKSPLAANLPYGEYVVCANHGGVVVEEPVSVNSHTSAKKIIEVKNSKAVLINVFQHNQALSGAEINIDGHYAGMAGQTYKLYYGSHWVQASYYGVTKTKHIKVDDKSDGEIKIKLPGRQRSRHNPFDIDYNRREWGVAFNYINRTWRFKVDSQTRKYSTWGDEGKSDHGMQMGITYTPYFGYGQGLVTGLYWQMFFSEMSDFDDSPTWYDHALYVPLQYQFRLPLGEDFSLYVNGGVAMTLGLSNELNYGENEGSIQLGYGENSDYGTYMPNRVQWSVPVGAGLQWKALVLDFKYSFGLNDNADMYEASDDVKASCKMRTWSLGLHFVF
ncbi:MAG: PEGA domain-containing protein [Muribaculaceae bacterium]|nr:PEGA domain-containing protein [Muribaculaceae bacterium]